MQFVSVMLPTFYGPYLINDDRDGIEKFEISAIHKYMQANDFAYCVECKDDVAFMTYHDLYDYGVPACDCVEYTFVMKEESK